MTAALTQEDMRLLGKTTAIRERMIDQFNPELVAKDQKEMFGFITLLDSTDRGIIARAKITLEEEQNKSMGDVQATMAAMLLTIHGSINKSTRGPDTTIALPANAESGAVTGQRHIGLDEITLAEFQQK